MWQPVRFELKTCWNSGDEIFSLYCFVQEYLRNSHSSVRCGQYNVTGTWSMNLMEEIRDDLEPASRTRSCIFSSWAWYKQQKLTVGLLSFKFIIFWQTNICVSWNLAAQTGAAWKLTLGLVYVPSLTHWSWGSFGFLMKGFPLTLLLQEIIWSTLLSVLMQHLPAGQVWHGIAERPHSSAGSQKENDLLVQTLTLAVPWRQWSRTQTAWNCDLFQYFSVPSN